MPLRDLTPDEQAKLQAQGIDPTGYQYDTDATSAPIGMTQSGAVGATLKGHAGSILGGGGAAVGTMLALAPFTEGLSLIPAAGITLLGGTAAGVAGGYAGQKTQEALQSEETNKAQAEALARAATEHPITSAVTDIAAGALASGGRPSLDALRTGRGIIGSLGGKVMSEVEKKAAANTAIQAAINPAIATGTSLATTGELPSGKELLEQAAGGAVFSKSWLPHGRIPGGEPNQKEQNPANSSTQTTALDNTLGEVVPPAPKVEETPVIKEPEVIPPSAKETIPSEGVGDESIATDVIPPVTTEEVLPKKQLADESGLPRPAVAIENAPEHLTAEDLAQLEEDNTIHSSPAKQPAFLVNAHELLNDEKFGLKANSSGAYNGTQLLGTLKNKMTPMEKDIYEKAGIDQAFDGKIVSKEDAQKWLLDNTPKAEVHTYGMERKVSEAKREYAALRHNWQETLNEDQNDVLRRYMTGNMTEQYVAARYGQDFANKAKRYNELFLTTNKEPADTSPRATSAYSHVSAYLAKAAEHVKNAYTHLADMFRANPRMMEIPLENEYLGRKPEDYVTQQPNGKYMVNPNPHVGPMDSIHPGKLYATREEALQAAKNLHTNLQILDKLEEHGIRPKWTKSTQEALKNGTELPSNVQRVDVVVPQNLDKNTARYKELAQKKRTPQEDSEYASLDSMIRRAGNDRTMLWQPDNLHENLPNTLGWAMIQYKTGPKGEKIAVIVEAQSRWGQEVRAEQQKLKTLQDAGKTTATKTGMNEHPLLRDYNRLILKAAIEQARKEGATHIVVSDAETAMMTEGHDNTSARRGTEGEIEYNTEKEAREEAVGYAENNPVVTERNGKWYMRLGLDQELGMRLNYDTILPKIAEELTGSKGERVSLGEHKNAYGERIATGGPVVGNKPRSNLIFRNADGTPKTDVSGRMYPIDKIPSREPKLFGKQYSQLSDYNRYTELSSQLVKQEQVTPEGKAKFGEVWKEIETIKNKYNGNPPPKPRDTIYNPAALQQKIRSGKETTGSVLQHLSETEGHPFQELAKSLLETSDAESLKTPWVHDNTLDVNNDKRTHYSSGKDHVRISDSAVGDARVVMEEAIHSLTSKKIPNFQGRGAAHYQELMYYKEHGDNEAVKDLINAYLETADKMGIKNKLFRDDEIVAREYPEDGDPEVIHTEYHKGAANQADLAQQHIKGDSFTGYAMGNLHEFIAQAFKDEGFQKVLEKIKTTDGRSVWQKVVDAVKKMLGLSPKEGSMLERVLRSSSELIAQDRPEVIQRRQLALDKEQLARDQQDHSAPPFSVIPKSAETDSLVDVSRKGFLRPWESTFDKVARVSTALSNAFHEWRATKDKYTAWKDTALTDLKPFSKELVDKVMALHREAYRTEGTLNLKNEDAKKVSKILTDYYSKIADERRALGLRINGREAGKNPYYVPDMLSDQSLATLTLHSQSPEAQKIENTWITHVVEESKGVVKADEARENIRHYIEALGGSKQNYKAVEFGAIRKAAGYGMPEGIRELGAVHSLDKYGRRAAADLALYSKLESKPEIAASLKLKNPNTGESYTHINSQNKLNQATEVRNAMKWVTNGFAGTMSESMPKIAALVRVVNNALLGTGTGIRNITQAPALMLPYLHNLNDFKAIARGLQNIRENSRLSLETGARSPNIDKLIFNELKYAPDRFTAYAQKVATMLRKYQGAELIENVTRDTTFSIGKELTLNRIVEAQNGNKKSQEWLKKFSTIVDGDITKLKGAKLEEAVNQTAKNFVDANQGTYGGSGLPAGIVDSQFAPFYSLAKWSVEKSNVIYKDVVKPAIEGKNYLPLITYTFGSLLTGAAIQQLNELLTNRKGQDPTVKEAWKHRDAVSVTSEFATLMQLSSFGGIVGDGMKMLSDIALHGKVPRNIVSFPTATAAINLEEKTTDMLEALRQGEDPWEVWKAYSLDMITHNVQLARMIANRTVSEDDTERSDKFRDLRVFNELEGEPASSITTPNKFLKIDERKFKQEGDVGKAVEMIPSLIQKAISRAGDDPFKLKEELSSLKSNNYQIFPSMENAPIKFFKYLTYLKQSQGEEAANARLMDYLQQSQVNRVKSSLVP